MRTVILGALAALFITAPALAANRSCTGDASTTAGATVNVEFTVDASGAITDRSANWRPGGMASGIAALLGGAPVLAINYAHPSEAGLGPVTSVSGFSMSMDKGDALSDAILAIILDGDGTHEWSVKPTLAVTTFNDKKDGPMTMTTAMGTLAEAASDKGPVNPDLLAAIDNAKSARMGFRKGDQVIGGVADANLSDHAGRDAAFHKAWAATMKAAQKPNRCDKQD
jgi:hypothetical protein